MWTCMTLYNRPQVCFTPDLRLEWLLALVSIFIGCICITTTIILLASSHWDRNVIPYARWVGFTASKTNRPSVCRCPITDDCVFTFQWYCFVLLPSSFQWVFTYQKSAANRINFQTAIKWASRTFYLCCRSG